MLMVAVPLFLEVAGCASAALDSVCFVAPSAKFEKISAALCEELRWKSLLRSLLKLALLSFSLGVPSSLYISRMAASSYCGRTGVGSSGEATAPQVLGCLEGMMVSLALSCLS